MTQKQEARLPLKEQGASLMHSSHLIILLLSGTGLFEFIYTLLVGFLPKSMATDIYESTGIALTVGLVCVLSKEPPHIFA